MSERRGLRLNATFKLDNRSMYWQQDLLVCPLESVGLMAVSSEGGSRQGAVWISSRLFVTCFVWQLHDYQTEYFLLRIDNMARGIEAWSKYFFVGVFGRTL